MADALALEADEGRNKRRNASGSSKYALIRRYPNGAIHVSAAHISYTEYIGI